jgi:hypothetical protein
MPRRWGYSSGLPRVRRASPPETIIDIPQKKLSEMPGDSPAAVRLQQERAMKAVEELKWCGLFGQFLADEQGAFGLSIPVG